MPPSTTRDFSHRVLRRQVLVPLTALACLLSLGALLRAFLRLGADYRSGALNFLFDLDADHSFAAWYCNLLFIAVAVLWFLAASGRVAGAATGQSSGKARLQFGLWGCVFLALSLLEATAPQQKFIEQLRLRLFDITWLTTIPWAAPVAAAVAALLLTLLLLTQMPQQFQRRLVVAAAVIVSGTVGLEIQTGLWALTHGTGNYSYHILVVLKESMKMIGTLLLISCLIDLVVARYRGTAESAVGMQRFVLLGRALLKGVGVLLVLQAATAAAFFASTALLPATSREGYREAQNLQSILRRGSFSTWTQSTTDSSVFSGRWHNDDHLLISFGDTEEFLEFELLIDKPGMYRISAYLSKSPEYGIVEFYLNGKRLNGALDLYHPVQTVSFGPVDLDRRYLAAGGHRLRLVAKGQAPKGSRYAVGFDGVQLLYTGAGRP